MNKAVRVNNADDSNLFKDYQDGRKLDIFYFAFPIAKFSTKKMFVFFRAEISKLLKFYRQRRR